MVAGAEEKICGQRFVVRDLWSRFVVKICGQRLTNFAGKILQRSKTSWTICPIPIRPFDYIVKAGQAARPKTKELKTVNKEKS